MYCLQFLGQFAIYLKKTAPGKLLFQSNELLKNIQLGRLDSKSLHRSSAASYLYTYWSMFLHPFFYFTVCTFISFLEKKNLQNLIFHLIYFEKFGIVKPSLHTQSCNRRPLCSTFRFENLSISPEKKSFFCFRGQKVKNRNICDFILCNFLVRTQQCF